MTESHSCSRFAHAASAWRGPRPGYCTAQSEIVGGSSRGQSRKVEAEPPACGKPIRRTCGWSADGVSVVSQGPMLDPLLCWDLSCMRARGMSRDMIRSYMGCQQLQGVQL